MRRISKGSRLTLLMCGFLVCCQLVILISLLTFGLEAEGKTENFTEVLATSATWPRYRGPNHDGSSTETGWLARFPSTGPKVLWRASVGVGCSSVTVSDGKAYTMGNTEDKDTVFCLDASTGLVIWRYSYACPKEHPTYSGPLATPTVHGKRVYTLSRKGQVFCFDAASGKVIWSTNLQEDLHVRQPGYSFAGSPLVDGELVILNGGMNSGVALDKNSGRMVWQSDNGPNAYASPVPFKLGNQRGVAIFTEKWLAGVNATTGKELWRYPWKFRTITVATPIVSGNKIFISSGYGAGCALLKISRDGPSVVWQNKNMRNHFSTCVLWKGNLYGFDGDLNTRFVNLRCLDFQTGEVRWQHKGLGMGALTTADGKLIILTERGELVIAEASPDEFKGLSRAQILSGKCANEPVLSGGRIYCRNIQGDLVCLDVRLP